MSQHRRVSDEALREAYERLGSVHKVGLELGVGGSSVHARLVRLGAVHPKRLVWTEAANDELREKYEPYVGAGRLGELATHFGVAKTSLCKQAKTLGLTNQRRRRPSQATWKYINETTARREWAAFRKSSLGLVAYCAKRGYDDLGFSRAMRRFFPDEWDAVIELKAPRGSLYRRGRAVEYLVRDHLRARGFFVMRSPASKTPIDILAVKHGLVVMVQCKRSGDLHVEEWNTLFALATSVGALPVLAALPSGRNSLVFYQLLAPKTGRKQAQPRHAIEFDEKGWKRRP